MLDELHVEMAAPSNFLEGCGWIEALVQAGVATSGTVDSFLKTSHVTRT